MFKSSFHDYCLSGQTNWYHIFQRLPQHVSCRDFTVNGGTFHLGLSEHREREAVVNLSKHIHFTMNFHSDISLGWLVVAIMMEKVSSKLWHEENLPTYPTFITVIRVFVYTCEVLADSTKISWHLCSTATTFSTIFSNLQREIIFVFSDWENH